MPNQRDGPHTKFATPLKKYKPTIIKRLSTLADNIAAKMEPIA